MPPLSALFLCKGSVRATLFFMLELDLARRQVQRGHDRQVATARGNRQRQPPEKSSNIKKEGQAAA